LDLEYIFDNVCCYCNSNVARLLLDNHSKITNNALYNVCQHGKQHIMKCVVKRYQIKYDDWNKLLFFACGGSCGWDSESRSNTLKYSDDYRSLIKLLIKNGATVCDWCDKSMQEHLFKK
jgi:hypothetical protein